MVSLFVVTGIFMLMILTNQKNQYPWYTIAMPIIGIGLCFLLVPPTEEWEYKPWQAKARQVEQQER